MESSTIAPGTRRWGVKHFPTGDLFFAVYEDQGDALHIAARHGYDILNDVVEVEWQEPTEAWEPVPDADNYGIRRKSTEAIAILRPADEDLEIVRRVVTPGRWVKVGQ